MQAASIATKIKDTVNPDLAALVHRDRVLLGEVCAALELDPSPINLAQVAVAMYSAKLATHQEYPKMVYPDGDQQPGVTVHNANEERAIKAKAVKKA